MAITQLRFEPRAKRIYAQARADGHTKKEARRILKRHLSDVVYRRMLRDAARPAAELPSSLHDRARPRRSQDGAPYRTNDLDGIAVGRDLRRRRGSVQTSATCSQGRRSPPNASTCNLGVAAGPLNLT
jgi:hypothetical protein